MDVRHDHGESFCRKSERQPFHQALVSEIVFFVFLEASWRMRREACVLLKTGIRSIPVFHTNFCGGADLSYRPQGMNFSLPSGKIVPTLAASARIP